ncbi:12.5K [Simian adenovirus 17]|uniref:12.5K n=1 Tax=Simian adenovirus 17 TaxID=1715779 RepID=A0A2H4CK02_9ADEN|nr:12.5K [Simian adenovirus 17]
MTDGAAVTARRQHLHHCQRPRCFAREACEFIYFQLAPDQLQGPSHGVKLVIEEELESNCLRCFTSRPILVERERGKATLTLYCICDSPELHEDLCCLLCAEFNR